MKCMSSNEDPRNISLRSRKLLARKRPVRERCVEEGIVSDVLGGGGGCFGVGVDVLGWEWMFWGLKLIYRGV